VKSDIIRAKPFKAPAKTAPKKAHILCGSADANST
jgi:hypothetical protein